MDQLTIFRYVSQKPSLYAYADVSSWWSINWSSLYLHPYFVCANSESSGETLKMRRLIGFVTLAISDKISCTDTYIHVDLYKHTSSLFGPVDDT